MALISSSSSRLCDARVEAYRAEFGMILANRIIESEAADFLWEARVAERYLGQHCGLGCIEDEFDRDLSRVAVLSCLAGEWSAGVCLVDGEGDPVELVWQRTFADAAVAEEAFSQAN